MTHPLAARTHGCGELRAEHAGQAVRLCGWVANRRDHGGVHFVDLRDRYGLVQLKVDEDSSTEARESLSDLHPEDCVAVEGRVCRREGGMENDERPTGAIEIEVESVRVLSRSKVPPFEIADVIDVPEELRLKHRYLDMRRSPVRHLLELRSRANQAMRTTLHALDFLEIETPMLTRSTPEGARDYLVPSRHRPGNCYALPQSPQIFKQLCMVGGLDRYFQFARCMRDEDLRADRQPEFSQLDLEMAFATEEDIYGVIEQIVVGLCAALGQPIPDLPLPRMTHAEALRVYASDKPDLRIPLSVVDLAEEAALTEFKVFTNVLEQGGFVRGIRVPGGAALSRKQIDLLEQTARDAGAGGAAWCKLAEDGKPTGPLARFLSENAEPLAEPSGLKPGDLLLVVADRPRRALVALDALIRRIADLMDLREDNARWLWITEFPLFEQGDDGDWTPSHHPFTAPSSEDLHALEAGKKDGVRSRAYDLVLNGVELGSGSVRIHERTVQEMVFAAIGMDPAEAARRFDFLLEAFEYGPPPHAGFAIGLDRLFAELTYADSIRDMIAFPKTLTGTCPLTGAPTAVDASQLADLRIVSTASPEDEAEAGQ